MEFNQMINEIEDYVLNFFNEGSCKQYCYHNEMHTNSVVAAVKEMAVYYKLSSEDRFVLIASAYFHDLGYVKGGAQEHEERGVDIATTFLESIAVDSKLIEKVQRCILATKLPQDPQDLLEQIICDADLFHLGTPLFVERNKLLRKEVEKLCGEQMDKSEWRASTIQLFETHKYHTQYAQDKLNEGKQINLISLKKEKKKSVDGKVNNDLSKQNVELNLMKRPQRGIETMFRVTSTNSQRLSDMADSKANLLLTVNSIILSLVVSVLLRSLDKNVHLVVPTIILMTIVVVVMVLSILSTIPKIPKGYFTEDQVENKSVNLLFFGNFYKMPLSSYKSGMDKAMGDSDFLYGMLTRDVYSQGVVLGRKYKLLRYAYGTFMFGLIISVISFVIAILNY